MDASAEVLRLEVGAYREELLAHCHEHIVRQAPCYPINSLMNGGLVIGERGDPARMNKLSAQNREKLADAHRYLGNNLDRTNYASYRKSHLPIGSGVVEAGCKTVVKQRMCGSGMKWKQRGADAVLTLRSMVLSGKRWAEFWRKVSQYGLSKL